MSRERAEKQRDQPKVKSSKNTRACTDCGKPTPNYRCERCWKKRRGFGFANSGDVPEICRERRKKAAPYRPDVFKPLAPRLALPDRQAEFFARQQQTQENTMTKQTYTTSELAAALGVTVRDIANAKYSPAKNPIPGSGVHTVREGMREKNITWEQVVLSRGGRQPGSVKAAPVEAKPPTVAPDPAPVPVTEPAKQDEKFEPILPPVEGKTGGANPLPLSLEELELAVLGMVPLERLLGEVKRRLAGVVTTFSL
ncbi:MAG: hypothetical protein FWG04_02740 [Desulfovibrionaceae bacterium]|nr:hypothetical protein [Desulfovibrionaceae bacterium]